MKSYGRPRALAAATVVAVGTGLGIWRLHAAPHAQAALPALTVGRGDVVQTVGGVGRIVHAAAVSQIALPSSSGGGAAAAPAAAGSAPADSVFPRTSGHVAEPLLASPPAGTAGASTTPGLVASSKLEATQVATIIAGH